MKYSFAVRVFLVFWVQASAFGGEVESDYFLIDGNPAAVKYESHRLVRLPIQDADTVEGLERLESIFALTHAPMLRALNGATAATVAPLSEPQLPRYGIPMFELAGQSPGQFRPLTSVIWSGSTAFRDVPLVRKDIDAGIRKKLIADSRKQIESHLDFRKDPAVGRRLTAEHPFLREYGAPSESPDLAIIDVLWHIKDLPPELSDRGLDAVRPFVSVEYIVDVRSEQTIFRTVESELDQQSGRSVRFFKEPQGPLLMATYIGCEDGAEPLLLDVNHEKYGTGDESAVPAVWHCFPAR